VDGVGPDRKGEERCSRREKNIDRHGTTEHGALKKIMQLM
jgi:hypothetical protein